jgi:hypothetical protein
MANVTRDDIIANTERPEGWRVVTQVSDFAHERPLSLNSPAYVAESVSRIAPRTCWAWDSTMEVGVGKAGGSWFNLSSTGAQMPQPRHERNGNMLASKRAFGSSVYNASRFADPSTRINNSSLSLFAYPYPEWQISRHEGVTRERGEYEGG